MFEKRPYEWVEELIAILESDQVVPPKHVVRVDLYRLHLEMALDVLRDELDRWRSAGKPANLMRPSDLSDEAADAFCCSLKKASWCAFMPARDNDDFASSGVIEVGETVAVSGIVSVAAQPIFSQTAASRRGGRS